MTEKKNESTFSITPGQLLAAAREARSLSQADIAKHMRLSVYSINEIEHDDYEHIGVRTFVRGYLSSYARLVSIPEKQVLDALDASGLMPADTNSVLPRIEGAPVLNVTYQQQSYRFNRRWVMAATAGVVVIAVAVIWMNSSKDAVDKTQVAAKALKSADTIALSQPSDTTSMPVVAISQPVIVSSHTAKVEKKNATKNSDAKKMKDHHTHHAKTENGFVVKPAVAMHTTYTIKPAT